MKFVRECMENYIESLPPASAGRLQAQLFGAAAGRESSAPSTSAATSPLRTRKLKKKDPDGGKTRAGKEKTKKKATVKKRPVSSYLQPTAATAKRVRTECNVFVFCFASSLPRRVYEPCSLCDRVQNEEVSQQREQIERAQEQRLQKDIGRQRSELLSRKGPRGASETGPGTPSQSGVEESQLRCDPFPRGFCEGGSAMDASSERRGFNFIRR